MPQNGGKTAPPVVAKVVAKPEVESSGKSNLPLTIQDDTDDITIDDDDITGESGWRLEKNSNGYYRWRWQLKNDDGTPVTYVNKSSKTGYKRGSKYVGKKDN